MKKFNLILLPFIFVLVMGCQEKHDIDKLKSQIDSINDQIIKSILDNKPESTLKFYKDDAISMPSYQPMMKGMDAFKEQIEKQKEMPMNMKSFSLTQTDLFVSGKFIIDIGTYELTMDWPDAPDGEWKDNGKYLNLFEIQDDGSLLIKAETWNTDTNPWQDMMKNEGEEK